MRQRDRPDVDDDIGLLLDLMAEDAPTGVDVNKPSKILTDSNRYYSVSEATMTTSIALSPHFEEFIRAQIDSGRYNVSVNSVTY
ncbi:type II toxin-antitoxin system ParD family antitoxin [Sodalis sp. RH24]|uniref:ribbon-helix-helix domain-containing protein n=1 Tax=unclassified Sodalis (in: enterobacteria) TaxID=2636512 RepID=UPI0039B472A7